MGPMDAPGGGSGGAAGGGAATRPRQVTAAAWFIVLGSGLLVIGAFETIAHLRSLETRASIEQVLADPPFSDSGIGLESVRAAMHAAAMVLGGCATATAILGYQLLRRDRTARIALTVLAVPLVVAGLVTDPFLTAMVAVAIAMLWVHPARDWFSG